MSRRSVLAATLGLAVLVLFAVWGGAAALTGQERDLPLVAKLGLGALACALLWLARHSADRGWDEPPRFR